MISPIDIVYSLVALSMMHITCTHPLTLIGRRQLYMIKSRLVIHLTNLFDTLFMLIVLLTELQQFFSDKADIENTWHSGVIRSYAPCTEVIFYGIQPSVLQSS